MWHPMFLASALVVLLDVSIARADDLSDCIHAGMRMMVGSFDVEGGQLDAKGVSQEYKTAYRVEILETDSLYYYPASGEKEFASWRLHGDTVTIGQTSADGSLKSFEASIRCKVNKDNSIALIEDWVQADDSAPSTASTADDDPVTRWQYRQSRILRSTSIHGSIQLREEGSALPLMAVNTYIARRTK